MRKIYATLTILVLSVIVYVIYFHGTSESIAKKSSETVEINKSDKKLARTGIHENDKKPGRIAEKIHGTHAKKPARTIAIPRKKKKPTKIAVQSKKRVVDFKKYSRDQPFAVGQDDERVPPRITDMRIDDPQLIKTIQEVWLEPPSKKPYNFTNPESMSHSMFKQDLYVDNLLNHKTGGFFIEAGAVDGETASNSFFFEMKRKWTGLLVEPDPIAYSLLRTKHRNAYTVNACLDEKVSKATFDVEWRHGHIERGTNGSLTKKTLAHDFPRYTSTVHCFPIYSLLLAIKQTTVDYFSLDVESAEPFVLKAIPFDKVDIKVLCIEWMHCGEKAIRDILVPAGYEFVKKMNFDVIYVKKSWKYGHQRQ